MGYQFRWTCRGGQESGGDGTVGMRRGVGNGGGNFGFEVGVCHTGNAYEHVYFLIREAASTQFALGTAEVSEVAWMPATSVLHALRTVDDGYALRTKQYVDCMEKELVKICKF